MVFSEAYSPEPTSGPTLSRKSHYSTLHGLKLISILYRGGCSNGCGRLASSSLAFLLPRVLGERTPYSALQRPSSASADPSAFTSRRWLVRKGRIDEAKHVLKSVTSSYHTEFDADKAVSLMVHTNALEKSMTEGTNYIDCLRGVDRRRTEIACVVWAIQNLSGVSTASDPPFLSHTFAELELTCLLYSPLSWDTVPTSFSRLASLPSAPSTCHLRSVSRLRAETLDSH